MRYHLRRMILLLSQPLQNLKSQNHLCQNLEFPAKPESCLKANLGIFLDEVQYLSPEELASLIVACREVAQRNLPLFFVGAGLPQIAALSGNAKSYAERHFTYPQVGQLDATAARAAPSTQ
jgi:hypothetical protein